MVRLAAAHVCQSASSQPHPPFAQEEPSSTGTAPAFTNAPPPSATWDAASLSMDAVTSLGSGLATLATSVSDWVADLASAFDSGWGENDEDEEGT